MDLLIPLVFIILLSIVFVATQKKTNNKLLSLLAVVALILLFCFIQMKNEYEGFVSNMAPLDYKMGKCGGINAKDMESIERPDRQYDGLVIGAGGKQDYSLLTNDKVAYHSPVGDAYSLNPDLAMTETYPSVDGNSKSPKHMFMFAYNRSSPECCPSTFSSSRGCVCMSNNQRNYINSRGSNKTKNGNPDF
jgi:hypothetical protein